MTLTPEDIESKRFHDAFRGYNHEEVDLFLDEVAASFKALYLQVEATTQRARELETQIDTGRQMFEDSRRAIDESRRLADENRRLLDENRRAVEEARRLGKEARRPAVEEPAYVPSIPTPAHPAPSVGFSAANAESILKRTLLAAQRAADEAVAEAEAQAEQIVADARSRAAQLDSESSRRAAAAVSGAEDRLRRIAEQARRLRELYTEHHARLRTFVEGQLQSLSVLGPPPDDLDVAVPEDPIRLPPVPPVEAAPAVPPAPEPPPALPSWATMPPPDTAPAAPLSSPSTAEPFWGTTLGGSADPSAGNARTDAQAGYTQEAGAWGDPVGVPGGGPAPPGPPRVADPSPPGAPDPAGTGPDPGMSPWSRPASSFSPRSSGEGADPGVSDRAPIFPPGSGSGSGSAPAEDDHASPAEDEAGRRSVRELFWGKG
ncbi:MAG TPA: DivIVA domain-containing protein [Actinomycetota bacterium]|nr:DivIVA domain-containing protein [Actinomycetota bacterium]